MAPGGATAVGGEAGRRRRATTADGEGWALRGHASAHVALLAGVVSPGDNTDPGAVATGVGFGGDAQGVGVSTSHWKVNRTIATSPSLRCPPLQGVNALPRTRGRLESSRSAAPCPVQSKGSGTR